MKTPRKPNKPHSPHPILTAECYLGPNIEPHFILLPLACIEAFQNAVRPFDTAKYWLDHPNVTTALLAIPLEQKLAYLSQVCGYYPHELAHLSPREIDIRFLWLAAIEAEGVGPEDETDNFDPDSL